LEQFLKTNKNSVAVVPDDRWQQAQDWELEVWRSAQRGSPIRRLLSAAVRRRPLNDDWNAWWFQQFEGYRCLPMSLENVIEVGCGPYTNVRLIRRGRRIGHLYCSDPLARHYAGFKSGWLSHAYRNREILLDDHPAESLPFADNVFDLTVMINVLDHVRDAEACLAVVAKITRGLLVLGQDLTDETDPGEYDVGHPIRMDHHFLDESLGPSFESVLHKILSRENGRDPAAHYGTFVYVGKKRRASAGS
jgi:Methyltransferase domain